MAATTIPAWLTQLRELETLIRRLDLRFHADATADPAPSGSPDQVHTAVWAKAQLTSHGTPVLEMEYSGCFRLHYQAPAPTVIDVQSPVVAAAGGTLAGQLV